MNILSTPTGSTFNMSNPVRSNLIMVLDNNGRQVFDPLAKLTGNIQAQKDITGEFTELEVDHSFGKSWISEEYLWQ